MMSVEPSCPQCGAPMPPDDPRGPCPGCARRPDAAARPPTLSRPGQDVTIEVTSGVLETIARSIGPVPRVLLRDTDAGAEPHLHRPISPGMPASGDRPARLRLLGEIARGGMGAVLKGRDEDLGRDLAVKVLLEQHRDDPDLVRRFVEEAQIGGQLQHPGVVPVYELGALADRRPYFAMKLVKGRTLAELLADRKGPADGLPRSLGIFEQVCRTVAYAHARGVIHRDLKPSNIMVGGFGEVQVMDWGLAKILTRGGAADDAAAGKQPAPGEIIATSRSRGGPDTDLSQAGSIMGTPAYMPPEQGRGETGRIDERADVFALGSILCEILTGLPAFVGRSAREIHLRAAQGETAGAIGRLEASGADPELIALARDCLAVEPGDRPRNARAVSDRVTAHLAGVQERLRASERERAVAEARAVEERRKRRWQLGLAASIAAFLLLGGVGLAAFAALLDRKNGELTAANAALDRQRTRAEDRERQAIDAVGRFRDVVAENPELKDSPELEGLRKALLDEPLAFFRSLREALQMDGDTRPESLARLASASFELGNLADEIGDKSDALAAYREALAIRQRLADDHPGSDRLRGDLATSLDRLATLLVTTGRPDEAMAANRSALGHWRALVESHPAVARHRSGLATSHYHLAKMLHETDRLKEARPEYEAAVAAWESLAEAPDIREADRRAGLATVLVDLGSLLYTSGLTDEGTETIRSALAQWRTLLDADPTATRYRYELARTQTTLGHLLFFEDRDKAGLEYEAARPIWEALVKDHPSVTRYRGELALIHAALGNVHDLSGRPAEAFAERERSRDLWERLLDAHPDVPEYASQVGTMLNLLAKEDIEQGRFAEAGKLIRRAITLQRKGLDAYPENTLRRINLQNTYEHLGRVALGLNDPALRAEAERGIAEMQRGTAEVQAAPGLDRQLARIREGHLPDDSSEWAPLARMAYDARQYADAVRLWEALLAAQPELDVPPRIQIRYDAACCAALAAAGRDRVEPKPDDATRAKLRGQALAWLTAELAAWSDSLDAGSPQVSPLVAQVLRHWRQDTDLAGVREPDALAALPGAERADWRALWDRVDALLEKATTAPASSPSDSQSAAPQAPLPRPGS